MVTALVEITERRYRVRVWFGTHVIADYIGPKAVAERYEIAMQRRFAGLRVTNDLIGAPRVEPR